MSLKVRDLFGTTANAGDRNPVCSTSLGKTFSLSCLDEEVEKILRNHPMIKLTPKTITQKKHLLENLAAIRKQGIALDLEENVEGVTCVAAPIFDQHGPISMAALSISGPTTRVE